jgi:hypothetical protein
VSSVSETGRPKVIHPGFHEIDYYPAAQAATPSVVAISTARKENGFGQCLRDTKAGTVLLVR